MGLQSLDWVTLGGYFALIIGVAWWVIRKRKDTATDYFLAAATSAGGSSALRSSPRTSARSISSAWPERAPRTAWPWPLRAARLVPARAGLGLRSLLCPVARLHHAEFLEKRFSVHSAMSSPSSP